MEEKIIRKHVNILGVKIISSSKEGVLREVQSSFKSSSKYNIVTPNPEQILMAQDDLQFKDILNSANMAIPDGIGLVAAAKFNSLPRPENLITRYFVLFVQGLGIGFSTLFDRSWLESELKLIKGREIFIELIKLANKKGWKVVLVGDKYLSAQKAAKKLKLNFIKLEIVGFSGPDLDENGMPFSKKDSELEKKVVQKINKEKPDLLFIGFRAPVQEKWLYRWYKNLDFKCSMVVGGTFDYTSGKKPLPPGWVDDLNLEWLWRLVNKDQKIKRISRAFPEFAWKVFWNKLVKSS